MGTKVETTWHQCKVLKNVNIPVTLYAVPPKLSPAHSPPFQQAS